MGKSSHRSQTWLINIHKKKETEKKGTNRDPINWGLTADKNLAEMGGCLLNFSKHLSKGLYKEHTSKILSEVDSLA